MIYDDYIAYSRTYREKYGDKCVVFIQVGDFFELYAVQQDDQLMGADIYKICDLCHIQVSRKNKSIIENTPQNPLMAGFPLHAISKFVQILIQHQYTIVLIRQVTPPPNPKREVTEVISPSTYLNVSTQDHCYLMTVYWEKDSVGLACLDMTTGTSHIYETYRSALDEVKRWLHMFQPKEVLLMGDTFDSEVSLFVEAMVPSMVPQWGPLFEKLYLQSSYQEAILEKAFPTHKGLITVIESLGLERSPLATVAYCAMIQFAYEHNSQLVYKIEPPNFLKNKTHLVLESNSIQQLNLVSQHPQEKSLLMLLNRCATAFGSRLFKERLLNPWIDMSILEQSYDQIEFYQANHRFEFLHKELSNIVDLERLLRKITMGSLLPSEWSSIQMSMEACDRIFGFLKKEDTVLKEIQEGYRCLNLEECSKYHLSDIHTSLFQIGVHSDLDALAERIQTSECQLKEVAETITRLGENDSTLCRVDYNDRDGYFLIMTKKRWETVLKLNIPSFHVDKQILKLKEFTVKPISSSSSMVRILHPWLEEVSNRRLADQRKISQLNLTYYKDFLSQYDQTYHSKWRTWIQELAEMDVSVTHAKNALEYGYNRPTLVSHASSYVSMGSMRHPIIERLNLKNKYVSNSISLGKNHCGLLLYGINAAGKSSLMKAIGLNVLMAQTGMFVACETMELAPYHHLFTRILSHDNLYQGHSTFTVEMLELRNILQRCDASSLILGDELCSGTESVSGTAIVAAGIDHLLQQESTFVFATHLHELTQVSLIKDHPKLWIAHLHIDMDPETGKIIYDRQLKEGSGSSVYGIEVCRALRLPMDFLKKANRVRQEIQEESFHWVEPKISKYNKDVIVSQCQLCGNPAKETHHLQPQKDANVYNRIDSTYVHDRSNLIVLCEQCHLKQHHGDEKIIQTVQTSEGTEFVKENVIRTKSSLSIHQFFKYTLEGWKFRLTQRQKWKRLTQSNYLEVRMGFKKYDLDLPPDYNLFKQWSEEHQSEYLEL